MADQTVDFLTVDHYAEVQAKIPSIVDPVKGNKSLLSSALEELLVLEKKTRLAADQRSTVLLATTIVQLCKDCGEWQLLNEYILLLSKRRAQLKKVIQTIVQLGLKFVDETPDQKVKIALIETLRTVSTGKMFVELELARMTRLLAEMKEKDGDISGAAEIMQEVSVETIGSMEAREKLDFILEQVRLCIARKDYIRAEIISKKVTDKQLNKEDLQDLKLKHYNQMIELYSNRDAYLDISKCYQSIYNTKIVQEDEKQWSNALSRVVIFLALSSFDYEVSEMLERFKADPRIEQLSAFQALLTALTTQELIPWPLSIEQELKEHEEFQKKDRWNDLHKRIVQHNIRVISKYYTNIRADRLVQLLQLDADRTEEFLSEMVSSKQLQAKIDRCAGTIAFSQKRSPGAVLNDWAADISSMLQLVDKTCHLIDKENMMYGLA